MYRKVLVDQNDHAALKAAASRNHERFQDVQARAVSRYVETYANAKTDMLVAATDVQINNPAWQGWCVPSETWNKFAQLRAWSGLTTGTMLHEAVRLELEYQGVLDNISTELVSA